MADDEHFDVLRVIMRQLDVLEVVARTASVNENQSDQLLKTAAAKIENIVQIHTDGPSVINGRELSIERAAEVHVQGDSFSNIGANATIINRSNLQSSLNSVRTNTGEECADTLAQIARIVSASGNNDAVENFDALTAELSQPQAKRSLLKSYWTGIVTALPQVVELAQLGEKIAKIFT
jgi:hypothetical protein